ncbi:MAG TPA: hypothetical protein PLV42_07250 [bacterium]|nr:hypothetical protein [bacterium]
MKNDRPMLIVGGVLFVSLAIAVTALVMALRGSQIPSMVELGDLRDRMDALEAELDTLRAQGPDGGAKVKDVFSAAAMEEQMRKLRNEIDELKSGGGGQSAVLAIQDKQERILKDANKSYFRQWKDMLDANLAQNGFDEEARQPIVAGYSKLLEELEQAEMRWFRGEIDWDRAMDEVKTHSIEFYDTIERSSDTDTARRVIDIAFPTPEMKKFFFSGSGQ